ncbi:MAG: hypothetical protein GYA23_04505 [Methanomicrobiales archaeon]|nr:hypothetical protein [Methanomicrobiales archaeon]
MSEILMLLLGFLGVFAVGCSIALLALGKTIDEFPAGNEAKRTRSITSPIETTRVAVILFWALFVFGTWAVIQDSRIWLITGITTFFAISLFMFTALVFSFAVLNALRNKKQLAELPVIRLASPVPAVPVPAPQEEHIPAVPVLRKRYNNPVTDFMLNALLKKD